MIQDSSSAMQPADWIAVLLGLAAFGTSIWANFIAHKALKLGGRQRVAEFRQQWIENLRSHISEFKASAYRKRTARLRRERANKAKQKSEAKEWGERFLEYTEETSRHLEYVRLCLNPNESDHQELEKLMNRYADATTRREQTGLTAVSRKVLKKEWERLKIELSNT